MSSSKMITIFTKKFCIFEYFSTSVYEVVSLFD